MVKQKKVTVVLPAELLDRARDYCGKNITETIRQGLELVAAGRAYERLRGLRGKVDLRLDLDSLRADR